ncbi:MAG: hypothetical protein OXN27_13395 [Candidatus Poribacteria bacterium]|nr:hypothetical protein [Candidatus Poribacteria bacterium]
MNTGCSLAKAISDLDKAIRLDPDDARTYQTAGTIDLDHHHYKDAIDDYNAAILRKRDFADAYLRRGNAKMSLGQHAKAIIDYTIAIHFNPTDARAYLYRGVSKWALDQASEAQQDWRTALKLAKQAGDTKLVKPTAKLLESAATGELEGSDLKKINIRVSYQIR